MPVALATCAGLPDWEVDDEPLHAAFAARGVEIARPVWDDPAVDWSRFRACLIRTTWDYQEKREAFLAWAARASAATRLFNPLPIVRWNTHKSYLRELEAKGIPIAPTIWLEAGSHLDLAAALAEREWPAAFLKPAVGATARETMRFAADPDAVGAAQRHLDRMLAREDMLMQPYLRRVETEGERSAVFIDGRLSHAVRKVPVPGDYRVQDDFGASDAPVRLTGTEIDLARRAIAAAGAGDLLYARVDMLADEGGRPVLSELELVEPSMFFRHCPEAAPRLADALLARLG